MDVDTMLLEIDDHGFSHLSPTRKLAALNHAYQDLCSRELWPFLTDDTPVTTNVDGKVVTPANIRTVVRMANYTSKRQLTFLRLDDQAPQTEQWSITGDTRHYFWIGADLFVFPIPAATSGVLEIFFVKRPDDLAAGGAETTVLLPKEFHGTIVDGAVARLYRFDDDLEIAREFQNQFERGIESMRNALWMQTTEPDYIHVVNEDDFHDDSY